MMSQGCNRCDGIDLEKDFKIPNCSTCQWLNSMSIPMKCKAQGYKPTEEAYNTKECIELFNEGE